MKFCYVSIQAEPGVSCTGHLGCPLDVYAAPWTTMPLEETYQGRCWVYMSKLLHNQWAGQMILLDLCQSHAVVLSCQTLLKVAMNFQVSLLLPSDKGR